MYIILSSTNQQMTIQSYYEGVDKNIRNVNIVLQTLQTIHLTISLNLQLTQGYYLFVILQRSNVY